MLSDWTPADRHEEVEDKAKEKKLQQAEKKAEKEAAKRKKKGRDRKKKYRGTKAANDPEGFKKEQKDEKTWFRFQKDEPERAKGIKAKAAAARAE